MNYKVTFHHKQDKTRAIYEVEAPNEYRAETIAWGILYADVDPYAKENWYVYSRVKAEEV